MLGKLLKYEFKATGRILLPLYTVLLIFAFFNSFLFGNLRRTQAFNYFKGDFFDITLIVCIVAFTIIIVAVSVVTAFLIIQRFYKNLTCDEGYLMHTLPVTALQQVASKLIVAVVWSVLTVLLSAVSFGLIIFADIDIKDIYHIYHNFQNVEIYDKTVITIFLIETVVSIFIQFVTNISMIYLSIVIGSQANKHRIICSFAAYIVINSVISVISSLILKVTAVYDMAESIYGFSDFMEYMNYVFGYSIVINLCIFIICFVGTVYLVKNKLNLE